MLQVGLQPLKRKFCMKYEDINPQLAEERLMYLAEKNNIETIFTLERRDFSIYRLLKKPLTIIPATVWHALAVNR